MRRKSRGVCLWSKTASRIVEHAVDTVCVHCYAGQRRRLAVARIKVGSPDTLFPSNTLCSCLVRKHPLHPSKFPSHHSLPRLKPRARRFES